MEKIKQNIALVVGVGIPVAMVVLIAGIIYMPRWFDMTPPPAHDIFYAVGDEGAILRGVYDKAVAYPVYPMTGGAAWPKYIYRIADGKLVREDAGPAPKQYEGMPVVDMSPKFYLYRVSTNTSTPISFEDAEKYILDTNAKSPDGWEIVRARCGGGFFPFYDTSCDYNARYLKKGGTAIKMELNLSRDDYREPYFAWIIQ